MGRNRTGNVSRSTISKIWAKSGGRCEYEGCNELLYRDDLTNKELNGGLIAHIVAATPRGPRGDEVESARLVDDIDNVMLLCQKHHRLIDQEAEKEHPVERLRAMKKKHEDRIRTLTEIQESKISTPLMYAANIGEQTPHITHKEYASAMVPDNYPSSNSIEISFKNSSSYDNEEDFWAQESKQIDRAFRKEVKPILEDGDTDCISVFALAPQPLLVKLGTKLSDLHRVKVFQKHREPCTWKWLSQNEANPMRIIEPEDKSQKPVLVFALSASAISERVKARYGESASIWIVIAENPNNDMLRSEDQLQEFRRTTRSVLDKINTATTADSVDVFMAMPAACAVELGRVWMPKADKTLVLYDKNNAIGEDDVKTITIKQD